MNNFCDSLDDLYKLHMAANNLQHGIMKEKWSLFEPSKFVYAFFAFNSFYSIDWEQTVKAKSLVKYDYYSDGSTSESKKIRELRKFIYNTFVTMSKSENEKVELSYKLAQKFAERISDNASSTIDMLSGIVPDINVSVSMKDRFIRDFEALLNNQLVGKKCNDALDDVLYFVYRIRNNIFHGTKTVMDMMDEGQQFRLKIYYSILLAVNELLFEAIEQRVAWSKKRVENDHQVRDERRGWNIQTGYLNRTLSCTYKIAIPEGTLFYPCSGDDTYEPIVWFFDCINEFHFVDIVQAPSLPKAECKINGILRDDIKCLSGRSGWKEPIPKELVTEITVYEPYNAKLNNVNIEFLQQTCISAIKHQRNADEIYRQEWTLYNDKKLNIYSHIQDGLSAFLSIESISVFFLRGDNPQKGEGGSGQKWFQEKTFHLILDKLLDNGLIVTDGSGIDPDIQHDAPWKSLWKHYIAPRRDILDRPEDFNYYDRRFKYIGRRGYKYGPVYVWQVKRL